MNFSDIPATSAFTIGILMLCRRGLLFGATCLIGAPGFAQALHPMPKAGKRDWAAQVPVLRVGLLGGENEADRLRRVSGYKMLLEDTFQVPVKTYAAADYAGVIQAFAAGQIEIAFMSPAAYAAAWMQSNGNVLPLLTSQEADGSTSYVSVVYVRADSGIASVEELKGKSLAWADPNSASGYLIPRSEFRAMGIDPEPGRYFSRTGFAGGHEQGVVAVLGKQYDAGVTWSSGIGDAVEGYTRGMLRIMVEKKMLSMNDLRIIWKSRPIENGPLTVRADTPQSFRDDMLSIHQAIPTADPDVFHAMDMGSGKDWVPVRHEDYVVFIDLYKSEAAERRKG